MKSFIDQTGHRIFLENPPKRIISLVPSQTELLFDLGLDEQVIGITKFCAHPPEWFYTKKRIGGTKKLHIDIIHQLEPDLVIANKEENVRKEVEELSRHYPVWTSDVTDLPSACAMIEQVGSLTHTKEKAIEIISTIKSNFSKLQTLSPVMLGTKQRPKTCYLIWNDPYMTIGGDTFIHSMLEAGGFDNIFKNKLRYPIVTIADMVLSDCQLLFLSSEPFPFKQTHIGELQQALARVGLSDTKIALVDGEMFSWYGSRLQYAPAYFKALQRSIGNDQ
jgi:ABC-type Fe3+-hydroxamate transport system substrate-binding protein